jgi:hypothetical protein
MVKVFKEWRFFYPTPNAWYCASSMGNDCFGLVKDVFLLEEKLVFLLEENIQ